MGRIMFLPLIAAATGLISHGRWLLTQVMMGWANCFGAKKNLSSCCFMVAINFLVILSANANANMLSAAR